MPVILGIDSGPEKSGVAILDGSKVVLAGHFTHAEIGTLMTDPIITHCAIEQIGGGYGGMSKSLADACYWAGRYAERWMLNPKARSRSHEAIPIPRATIKNQLLGKAVGTDADVAAVVRTRIGQANVAKLPCGPRGGVVSHVWSALAVCLVADGLIRCGEAIYYRANW